MMREKNSHSIPKGIRRIFISWLIFVSLMLITVVPVFAALTLKQSSLDQPVAVEIASLLETTSSSNSNGVSTDSSTELIEASTAEEIETTVINTEAVLEEDSEVVSSDDSTQTVSTQEEISVSTAEANESTIDVISASSDENDTRSALQQVTLSVTPSVDTSNSTSVNSINVTTSQTYTDVSAQISITDQKPQNIPSIRLQNENEFIESYITIHLLGDSVVLSAEEIQSMTMTIKIKKNTNNNTPYTENQIYVLSYETNPLVSLAQPLIQEVVSPYTSGVWIPVTPSEITEDEEFIYYHVEAPSYFAAYAIVQAGIIEIQPYESMIPEIPWAAIFLTIIVATVLLIITLFKTGFIYRVDEPADGKNKENFFKETNQKWSYKLKLSTTLPELQTIRAPTFYYPTAPCPPQVITASSHIQETSEEREEDPMYL
jgi:hypothetical protein